MVLVPGRSECPVVPSKSHASIAGESPQRGTSAASQAILAPSHEATARPGTTHRSQCGQGRRSRCRRREVALDTGRGPVGARRARSVRKERVRAHRGASVSRRGGKHAEGCTAPQRAASGLGASGRTSSGKARGGGTCARLVEERRQEDPRPPGSARTDPRGQWRSHEWQAPSRSALSKQAHCVVQEGCGRLSRARGARWECRDQSERTRRAREASGIMRWHRALARASAEGPCAARRAAHLEASRAGQ